MNHQACINEILMAGADDWVPLAEVVGIVQEDGGVTAEEAIQDFSLKLIRKVVEQGLMEIGDVTEKDRGFRKWNLSIEESLQRVEREWCSLVKSPNFGYGCWLQSTAKGHEVGNRLLENESRGKS
jgi:hypothetical protein